MVIGGYLLRDCHWTEVHIPDILTSFLRVRKVILVLIVASMLVCQIYQSFSHIHMLVFTCLLCTCGGGEINVYLNLCLIWTAVWHSEMDCVQVFKMSMYLKYHLHVRDVAIPTCQACSSFCICFQAHVAPTIYKAECSVYVLYAHTCTVSVPRENSTDEG